MRVSGEGFGESLFWLRSKQILLAIGAWGCGGFVCTLGVTVLLRSWSRFFAWGSFELATELAITKKASIISEEDGSRRIDCRDAWWTAADFKGSVLALKIGWVVVMCKDFMRQWPRRSTMLSFFELDQHLQL